MWMDTVVAEWDSWTVKCADAFQVIKSAIGQGSVTVDSCPGSDFG